MKNVLKIIIFIANFVIIYIIFSYFFLPKINLYKYGMYNTSLYEILKKKKNTIDTIVLGDSLVYSSVSPMEIYNEYGYTVFDCAEPAQILSDTYEYFKIAMDSQNPKVVIIEPNIFFRDANKKPWYNRPLKIIKNALPLVKYHNNWKKILFKTGKVNNWTNITKGYKKNKKIKASINFDYMNKNLKNDPYIEDKDYATIPVNNYEYINKIVDYCKERNIKIVLISFPSQRSWNYEKHKVIKKISKEYNLEYKNLNFENEIKIDWKKETKDRGEHLNDQGAKKVSKYVGNYLKEINIVPNHKNEKGYEEWDKASKYYMNS